MSLTTSLDPASLAAIIGPLRQANLELARRYPGESGRRQPVHTVYGGAHLFRADSARKLGQLALRALDESAPDPASFAGALGLEDGGMARILHARVTEKLEREAVEDYRIDFEDGYGYRPDAEICSDGRNAVTPARPRNWVQELPSVRPLDAKPSRSMPKPRLPRTQRRCPRPRAENKERSKSSPPESGSTRVVPPPAARRRRPPEKGRAQDASRNPPSRSWSNSGRGTTRWSPGRSRAEKTCADRFTGRPR